MKGTHTTMDATIQEHQRTSHEQFIELNEKLTHMSEAHAQIITGTQRITEAAIAAHTAHTSLSTHVQGLQELLHTLQEAQHTHHQAVVTLAVQVQKNFSDGARERVELVTALDGIKQVQVQVVQVCVCV